MKEKIIKELYREINGTLKKYYEICRRSEEDDSVKEDLLNFIVHVSLELGKIVLKETKKDSE